MNHDLRRTAPKGVAGGDWVCRKCGMRKPLAEYGANDCPDPATDDDLIAAINERITPWNWRRHSGKRKSDD